MKKLVLLMLVLGMTSLANAAIVIGGLPAAGLRNDVVTMIIGNDEPASGGTTGLTLNVSQAENGSASVLGDWMLPPDVAATITDDGSGGLNFAFGDGTIGLNVMGNWLLATFTVPESAAIGSTVELSWSGNMFNTVPTYGFISVLPEPATIALLGLGGLALLRRRKK